MSLRLRIALLALALLPACASVSPERDPDDVDPLERVNRPIFAFNDALDRWALHPVAKGWDFITPRTVPVHLEQFFDNLRTPGWALNDLFQGDVRQSGVEWGRFFTNTTVGLAGFFDPAHHFFELEARDEDFGQTLGVWGTPPGAYLMLPFLGPSGVRELVALPVDLILDPLIFVPGGNLAYQINHRSLRVDEVEQLRSSALDLYSSLRNGYRQLRRTLILNGELSEENSDDFYELEEDDPE
jgi:phospholipid-binding lipoprotein MlaA